MEAKGVHVHINSEVTSIDPEQHSIKVVDVNNGEETESNVDSIACLKFTLRTDVSYDIYTDWNGLTPKETKTISLNDVNSGVILRTEDGSKQLFSILFTKKEKKIKLSFF